MYGTSELDQGSIATYAAWKADFLFAIPDAIKSEYAAPLQCAGGPRSLTHCNFMVLKARIGLA
jgi:D-arabinose 1-dehydrogenase-like Zn-dependent alcohol dehydrogenase